MRRTTWIALAVFIVLGAIALYVRANPPEPDDAPAFTPQPTQALLLEIAPGQVLGLKVTDVQNGESINMERDDQGAWHVIDPETAFELTNIVQIDTAVSQVGNLRVLTAFESVPALGQIGLDTPEYIITFSLNEGEELDLYIGATTPTGTGYYIQAGDEAPVAVGNGPINSLLDLLRTPPILEPTLEPEATPIP